MARVKKKITEVIRIMSFLAGLSILVLTARSLFSPVPSSLPHGFQARALALELVESTEDVKTIEAVYPASEIRNELNLDLYLFIPFYLLLFLGLGAWLSYSDIPYARMLGIAVAVCVIVAALWDVIEDLRTFSVLRDLNLASVDGIRQAALIKWTMLSLMMLLMAVPFVGRGGWVLIVGILYGLTGVIGVLGVVWDHSLLEWFFALIGVALLPTGKAMATIELRLRKHTQGGILI